ncbi:MAG: helix-turn-helix transcriptional regulator, partial [Cyanobacteria bacterium RYN_339]|nr:helix-turn-helix transcriptional regulator [Cyanobacteria bacterium RYN_339]
MSLPVILASKLTIPRLPAGGIVRARLAGAGAPVLLLSAGPGYGKSMALWQLADAARQAGTPVVWYGLDALDVDVAGFFQHLAAGLKAYVPAFGDRLAALLAGGHRDARALWGALFEEVAAYDLPGLLLVLDDAHHLSQHQPDTLGGLLYHADKLPAGVRVALATRRKPDLPLARAVAAGALEVIEAEALAFTPAEQEAFLQARADAGAIPPAWRARAEALQGWPLGLHLVAAGMGGSPRADVTGTDALMAYVAEEIYRVRPAAERAFMLRAALLEELTPDACREAAAAPDAVALLQALEQDHLVQRLGAGERYRFPGYLQAFLRAETERVHPELERMGWHADAAAFYVRQARPEAALPHWLAAREWELAIAAGRAAFPRLFAAGRHDQALAWVNLFPAPLGPGEAWLRLWRGQGLERAGRHEEAVLMYERARAGFQGAGDAAGELTATVRLATQAVRQGALQQFARLVQQATPLLVDGGDADRADLLLARAHVAATRGDEGLARECLQGVLQLSGADLASRHVAARLALAEDDLVRGETAAALGHAEAAGALGAQAGLAPALVEADLARARAFA